MKILLIGSNRFLGKNLMSYLQEMKNVEVITYNDNDQYEKISENVMSIDLIFNLSEFNITKESDKTYGVNLTSRLIDTLNSYGLNIPLVFLSKRQKTDDDYQKNEEVGKDYILSHYKNFFIYELEDVFGKWCLPVEKSLVADLCHNIANNVEMDPINPSKKLDLVYIDDVCKEMLRFTIENFPQKRNFLSVEPIKRTTIYDLLKLIYSFKDSMNGIFVPNTGDEFIKKLYSTYISYVPVQNYVVDIVQHVDERGSFSELVKTDQCGQFSFSVSKPGVVRGNHYHHTKMERFIVIKGNARISFENINDCNDHYTFDVSDSDLKCVTIPVGYTHKIENIGQDEMILCIWCNELFDEQSPDTFCKKIK